MSNINKIKAYIERLYDGEAPKHDQQCEFEDGYFTGIATISKFIDSLPEEKPSEDLEEAAEDCVWKSIDNNDPTLVPKFIPLLISLFISGAYWQKEQMELDGIVTLTESDFDAEKEKASEWGYNLCKKQMMKDAVEGFIFQSEDYYPKELVAQYNGELKHGDKVKIIIVKQ